MALDTVRASVNQGNIMEICLVVHPFIEHGRMGYHCYRGGVTVNASKGIIPTTEGYKILNEASSTDPECEVDSVETSTGIPIDIIEYIDGVTTFRGEDVETLLTQVLALTKRYPNDIVVVSTIDPYITKIVTTWFNTWKQTKRPIKGNGQLIEFHDLWTEILSANITFYPEIMMTLGHNYASIFANGRGNWDKVSPKRGYMTARASRPNLLWLTYWLDAIHLQCNPNHYYLASNRFIEDIGRDSTDTIYGVVQLTHRNAMMDEVRETVTEHALSNGILATNLNELFGKAVNTLIMHAGLRLMNRISQWTDTWGINKKILVVNEVDTVNMSVNVMTIGDIMHRELENFMQGDTESCRVTDVTEFFIDDDGKIHPNILNTAKVLLPTPNGSEQWHVIGRDIPPLNDIRRIITLHPIFYTVNLKVNNRLRAVFMVICDEGRAMYTTWHTHVSATKRV